MGDHGRARAPLRRTTRLLSSATARSTPGSAPASPPTVGSKALVTGASARTASATEYDGSQCLPNTLDSAKAAGKIVVCDRGVGARVDKSAEVKRAGGVGMILLNLIDQDMVADSHAVPTVAPEHPGSLSVKTYAGTAGATAQLVPGNRTGQGRRTRRSPTSPRAARPCRATATCSSRTSPHRA